MRLFVAIPLPDHARDALSELQSGLRVGRQVDPDQFHITLAFLPEVAPQACADLDAALEEITAWPFDVAFSGVDIFGGTRPRLLAAMVRPSPELDTLHRAVQGAARQAGLTPDRQKFKPHVTLARFGARPSASLADEVQRYLSYNARAEIPGFVAQEISLVQSTLGGAAPVYDDLADYPFRPLPEGWDEA